MFQCSCDTIEFAQWLISSKFVVNESPVTCVWRGTRINLNPNSLSVIQQNCSKKSTALYVCLGVACVIVVAVVATGLAIGIKKKRKLRKCKRNRDRAPLNLRNDTFDSKHIVFLMFSHKDEELVRQYFLSSLNYSISTFIQRQPNIAVGDDDFRPGFNILNEMLQTIQGSAVMMAVVSNNFCESRFCNDEHERAIDLEKPVVLVMAENVDESSMTPVLRDLFRRTVRGQIGVNSDSLVCTPTMEDLFYSVLELIE